MSETISIPGYTVHQLLGKGGMAAVYLATQESLNRQVAIKVLSDFSDQHAEARFFTEARTIAALNHPRIVTVYDVAHLEDGRPYISMEYLSGGDLNKLKGQALGDHYAVELIKQVAEGLSAVHKKGVIHRDIKPGNILFREDGSVALSDFGIAKDLTVDTELTQAGVSVGSPSYSSPEQIYGQALDQRSDIYSLGVVLLELLSGGNPYKGESYAETVVNHTEKPIPDLSEFRAQCQAVLQKMLAKQPDDRYADADELLHDLDGILAVGTNDVDQTTVRPAPVLTHNAQNLMQRLQPFQKIGAVVLGVCLVALLIFTMGYESETDRQIKALLDQAEDKIAEDRLIAPEFDNARYFYNQVLTLEPDNGDALDGLEEIEELLIERYLKLASKRFEEKRLNMPQGDSAVYYYRQVLAIDSENEAAQEGLQRVVEEHISLAKQAFNRKRYGVGLRHVRIALELAPEHPELQALKKKYRNKRNAFERIIDNVFN